MTITAFGDTLQVTNVSELNATVATRLRDDVRSALTDRISTVELDLSRTRFIDSSGLGALISIQKTMTSRQGKVAIVNPTAAVVQALELTRLHRVLEIVTR